MYLKKFCCIAAQCAAMRRIAPPYLFWGKDAFFHIKTNFRCIIILLNLMYAAKIYLHMSSLLLHNKFCNWVTYIYFIVVLIKYHCGGAMRRIAAHCAAMQQNFFEYMFSDSQTTSSWIEKLTQLDLCSKYVTLSNCAYPQKISLKTDDLNVICMKKLFWAHCAAMRRIAPQCCKASYF